MYKEFGISEEIEELANESEKEIERIFTEINKVCEFNSLKVLKAFQDNNISEMHFNGTTGYGYNDIGRDTIEKVFARDISCTRQLGSYSVYIRYTCTYSGLICYVKTRRYIN